MFRLMIGIMKERLNRLNRSDSDLQYVVHVGACVFLITLIVFLILFFVWQLGIENVLRLMIR